MAHYSEGIYRVRVIGQGFAESSAKKTPFFFLQVMPLGIVDVEDPDRLITPVDSKYDRLIKLWVNSTDNVERSVDKLFTLCQWNGDGGFRQLDPDTPNYTSFTGVEFEAICSHSQDGDKVYENWDLPGGGSQSQIENAKGLSRKLDTLFGKQLKKTGTAKPPTKAPSQDERLETVPPHGAPPPKDDVPF